LNFLVLLRFAFILGRIALILQKPLFFTSFFRNFVGRKQCHGLSLVLFEGQEESPGSTGHSTGENASYW